MSAAGFTHTGFVTPFLDSPKGLPNLRDMAAEEGRETLGQAASLLSGFSAVAIVDQNGQELEVLARRISSGASFRPWALEIISAAESKVRVVPGQVLDALRPVEIADISQIWTVGVGNVLALEVALEDGTIADNGVALTLTDAGSFERWSVEDEQVTTVRTPLWIFVAQSPESAAQVGAVGISSSVVALRLVAESHLLVAHDFIEVVEGQAYMTIALIPGHGTHALLPL